MLGKKAYYDISIIGAGNVGWHLATALEHAGHSVHEIYSQHPANAEALVGNLYQAEVLDSLDLIDSKANIFIIAVPDRIIPEILEKLFVPENSIVMHTSGTVPASIFEDTFDNYGVLYPLQTFSKHKAVDFKQIPLCIEANNKDSYKIIKSLSTTLSDHVEKIDSEARKHLHLAAVFACNFTNHLYKITEDYLEQRRIDSSLLFPLIEETTTKFMEIGPKAAQTGPARRSDITTMNAHLKLLADHPEMGKFYKLFSQSILDHY